MPIPQSFIQLLLQQKRRARLTGVPQDPYDFAVAGAEGAPGRLEAKRTQRLAEAEVATGAEQFQESLGQQKLHFTESLAEQKRAAMAMEREAGLSREAQMEAAKKAETQGYVGMGLQAPTAYYAGKALGLWGGEEAATVAPATLPTLLAGESAALGAGGAFTAGAGGPAALTGTLAEAGAFPTLTGEAALYAGGEAGAATGGTAAGAATGGTAAAAVTAEQIAPWAAGAAAVELQRPFISQPLAEKGAEELPGGEKEWAAGETIASRAGQGALIGTPFGATLPGAVIGAGVGVGETLIKTVSGGK